MSVFVTKNAERDLQETLDGIASVDPGAAERVRSHVQQVLTLLDGRIMDGSSTRLRSMKRVRRFFVHPFWLYYVRKGEVVVLLRAYHHARKPLQ